MLRQKNITCYRLKTLQKVNFTVTTLIFLIFLTLNNDFYADFRVSKRYWFWISKQKLNFFCVCSHVCSFLNYTVKSFVLGVQLRKQHDHITCHDRDRIINNVNLNINDML